jgi:hypothetical protein
LLISHIDIFLSFFPILSFSLVLTSFCLCIVGVRVIFAPDHSE